MIINNLGTVDLAERNLQAAMSRFEEAKKADPDYASAYNNLGAGLGMLERNDEALANYLKAVELDPQYTDARFNLARHFLGLERIQQAIETLEAVLPPDRQS